MKDAPVLPLYCSSEPPAEQPSPPDGRKRSSNLEAVPASPSNLETLFCFSISFLRHNAPHLLKFLSPFVLWVIPVRYFT